VPLTTSLSVMVCIGQLTLRMTKTDYYIQNLFVILHS
jgi:hypothetical protein